MTLRMTKELEQKFLNQLHDEPIMQITAEMIEFAENMAKHPVESKKVWSAAGSSMIIDWAKRINKEIEDNNLIGFFMYLEQKHMKEELQQSCLNLIGVLKKQLADERKGN